MNNRSHDTRISRKVMVRRMISCTVLALLVCVGDSASGKEPLEAFPAAEAGDVRYVVNLPKQSNEENYRVEVIVGKTAKLDTRNRYFFGGQIEEKSLPGWGYTYYEVEKLGPMAGTLIAVDPNKPKQDRFVRLGGEPYLIRYNSKLPIVVYVPKDAEVRYRIWKAAKESKPMEQR
jgi:ecotin